MMRIRANDLAKKVKENNPDTFGKVNEKRMTKIIGEALKELGALVKEEEKVWVKGLGVFVSKSREIEKDREKIVKKRIIFREAK